MYKLGKKPAVPGAMKFALAKYINKSVLPTPPWSFGFDYLVNDDKGNGVPWGMLGNDKYGDCVWAGAAHETMLWNAEAGVVVPFDEDSVLTDYSAVTGFNKHDPSTDNGTDMVVAASYRRRHGIHDANGNRHKVAAYLAIKPKDMEEHLIAAWLFGAVGLGIECPSTIFQQFDANEGWHYVPGANIIGGHYVPFLAHRKGMLRVATWGREQFMKSGFFEQYNDESVVYLSEEMFASKKFKNGQDINGFDLEQLKADLAALPA